MDLSLLVQSLPTAPPRRDNVNAQIEDSYSFGEALGKGAYGVVKKCIQKSTGQEFAVKVISKRAAGHRGLKAVYSEVEILQILRHCNIVDLVETFESAENLYIVLELVLGGELLSQVTLLQCYTENIARRILASLFNAVDFMHKKGVVHRDLKPSNLLFSRPTIDSEIKVADFGFSKLIGEETCLSGFVGTLCFMAPEVLMEESYGKAVDMWSCGVIMYLMLGGTLPFMGRNEDDFLDAMRLGHKFPRQHGWAKVSSEAKDLLSHLLQWEPLRRWPAGTALCHSWLRSGAMPQGSSPLTECLENLRHYLNHEPPIAASPQAPPSPSVGIHSVTQCPTLHGQGRHRLRGAPPNAGKVFEGSLSLAPVMEIDNLDVGLQTRSNAGPTVAGSPQQLSGEMWQQFLAAVKADHSLRRLAVTHLDVSDERLNQLAKCIAGHPSITEIDLSYNPLTALSTQALFQLVHQSPLLQSIILAGTKVPQDVAASLGEFLQARRQVSGNPGDHPRKVAVQSSIPQLPPPNLTSLPAGGRALLGQSSSYSHHSSRDCPTTSQRRHSGSLPPTLHGRARTNAIRGQTSSAPIPASSFHGPEITLPTPKRHSSAGPRRQRR